MVVAFHSFLVMTNDYYFYMILDRIAQYYLSGWITKNLLWFNIFSIKTTSKQGWGSNFFSLDPDPAQLKKNIRFRPKFELKEKIYLYLGKKA